MKQLDEMERMAREQLSGKAAADTHVRQLLRADKLARFIVDSIAVVRAAERLNANYRDTSGSMSRIDAIEDGIREASDAIDDLRRRLGGE